MTKYYDIGLNLFCRQFHEPEQILANALADGITCILTGSDMQENRLVCDFIKTHHAYGTAGIHPHNADHARPQDFDEIERLITQNPKMVAVGECGLDYDRMFSSKENQLRCLDRHIALAEKLHKPMFLHERDAADDFIGIFSRHPEICRRSVVHCFTGDRSTAEHYIAMGFFIGITGWICDDKRAEALRQAVSVIPLDRILIETDAPYLTPKNIKGLSRVNIPNNIRYVARALAGYMGVDEAVLIRHTRQNTESLFSL